MQTNRAIFLVFIAVSILFLSSSVSADWSVDILDEPYSHSEVSNNTTTVQIVNLTDNEGDPVDKSRLDGDSAELYYTYNATGGSRIEINNEYLAPGYYFAEFKVDSSKGLDVMSDLYDSSSGGGVKANDTQKLDVGNMKVDLMTDFSGQTDPKSEFDIRVNVTDDTSNGTFEDEAAVDLYFTNGSWSSETYRISNIDSDESGEYYKYSGLGPVDLKYNSTYVLHVNASESSDTGYQNPYGAQSMAIETLPELEGEIENLNASSGCNNQSFFTACERDTNINTAFNVTSANAENVNLTLELKDSDSGDWENHTTTELTQENGLFTGEVSVPDINTSVYDKEFRLAYNVSEGIRTKTFDRIIDYRDFTIADKSDSITGKGSYRVKLEIRKFFTPQLLEDSRINESLINITQPSGDVLQTFEVADMDRMPSPGHFKEKITIPVDAESGIYDMYVEVTNVYNETKSETFNFNVTDVEQTFTVNEDDEDFEKTVDKTGNHTFNLSFTNEMNTETNITTNVSEEIENFTVINEGENISLDAEESKNISLRFEIDSVDEYDAEIKFMDKATNYNSTLDVELQSDVDCNYREDTVCVITEDLNTSSDKIEDIEKEFRVFNFGARNESYSYSFDLSGNITEQASLETTDTVLNEVNDSETSNIIYSVSAPGFYSGTLEIDNDEDTVQIPISLDSDVEPTSTTISLPDSIELGDVLEGESTTAEIDLENTGDVEVTSTEISSEDYTVSADSASISPGDTETIEIEFSEVTSESGQLTVTAETDSDSTSETVDVSASVIPDYTDMASDLEQRVIDLDSEVSSDSEHQTELNNVQSTIQDLRTAYNQGNYDEAESLYNEVSNTLDDIEADVRSTNPPENPGSDTEESGGLPILPLFIAVFILLVIGFIGYSSVELEPGDPLYNVLGQ